MECLVDVTLAFQTDNDVLSFYGWRTNLTSFYADNFV